VAATSWLRFLRSAGVFAICGTFLRFGSSFIAGAFRFRFVASALLDRAFCGVLAHLLALLLALVLFVISAAFNVVSRLKAASLNDETQPIALDRIPD